MITQLASYVKINIFKYHNTLLQGGDIYFDNSFQLILEELLPMAYKGLNKAGVSPKDAEYYLKIIQNRITSNNGSQWATKSYRNLLKTKKRFEAIQVLTSKMYTKQQKEI